MPPHSPDHGLDLDHAGRPPSGGRPLSPRNDSPARSTITCRPVGDRACQARGQLLGAGDVELAPRTHEVDPWGGHARRQQQPIARIHYGPKLAPCCSGRGLGRGIRDTFGGTRANHDQITTVTRKPRTATRLTKRLCQFDST